MSKVKTFSNYVRLFSNC